MLDSLFLEKAQDALKSARLSLENGCPNSTANRAYYAVFHAARAALIAAGGEPEKSWSHDALQAAFANLIHRRKLYPSSLRGSASRLLLHRELADYGIDVVSSRAAKDALREAEEFVSHVEGRIAK